MKKPIAKILTISACLMASSAFAQDFEFNANNLTYDAGLSTLGAYIAPDYAYNDQIHLRLPMYYGGVSRTVSVEDVDFDAEVAVSSVALMGDYYIMGTGFRTSAGVAFGGYNVTGDWVNPELDGVTYNGTFKATVEQTSPVAPVLSFGYKKIYSGNWGFSAELGTRFTTMEVSTTGQENLPAAVQTQYQTSLDEVNSELSKVGVLPFFAIGVSYKF